MVLTLAVHPFELPDENRALNVELLPPLTAPPTPTVVVQLRPRQAEATPPSPVAQPAPQPPVSRPVEAPLPSPPTEARPAQPSLDKPVEVERRTAQAPRLQTQQAAPVIPEAPPEPVEVTRQAPALQPQVEVPRAQAPSRTQPLDTSRPAAPMPQAAAPETPAPQVLTNQQVIQAPTEIRPRERAPAAPPATSPAPSGGGAPPAGGSAGGQGRAGRPSADDFKGLPNLSGGAGAKGLGQATGCEDPDVYKQTAQERAACLQRFGQRARTTPELGLPIPSDKQARYDHFEACQAYKRQQIPGASDASSGTSVRGLGANPSLKECGPSQR